MYDTTLCTPRCPTIMQFTMESLMCQQKNYCTVNVLTQSYWFSGVILSADCVVEIIGSSEITWGDYDYYISYW